MIAAPLEDARQRTLRPRAYPFRQSSIAVILILTPVFVVLYWITVPQGTWLPVLAAHVALAGVFALFVCSYYLTVIRVDHSGVTRRSWYGRTQFIPRGSIDTLVRLDLSRSSSLYPRPQVFLLDSRGGLLARMQGIFWSTDAMDLLTHSLNVPAVMLPEPVTLRELDQALPGVLHWSERRLLKHQHDD